MSPSTDKELVRALRSIERRVTWLERVVYMAMGAIGAIATHPNLPNILT